MTPLVKSFKLNSKSEIPTVGFGTYLISNEDVKDAVHTAILSGYRHIDTAFSYSNEVGVGEGLHAALKSSGLSRSDLFVSTKL